MTPDALEQMQRTLAEMRANPRNPATAHGELMTLWDHRGRPRHLAPIVANEILAAQADLPRSAEDTLYTADPTKTEPAPESAPKDAPPGSVAVLEETEDALTERGGTAHQCPDCESSFQTESGLKRHQTRKHKGK